MKDEQKSSFEGCANLEGSREGLSEELGSPAQEDLVGIKGLTTVSDFYV